MVLALHDTTREQQLINRLSWLAAYDPLTGLPNRREFEARLSQALATLQRRDGPSGLRREDSQQHVLMLIDLDQFKIINDTCGHAAGDDMLQQVTDVMSQHLRDQDTLARMGGDEFGLLLINCPPENGEQKAEELRRAVSQIILTWGLRRFTISASIGLIHLDRPHSDLGAVMSAADMACYKAKDNGRNRVEVYRDDDEHLVARFGEMAWAQRLQTALKENRFCPVSYTHLDVYKRQAPDQRRHRHGDKNTLRALAPRRAGVWRAAVASRISESGDSESAEPVGGGPARQNQISIWVPNSQRSLPVNRVLPKKESWSASVSVNRSAYLKPFRLLSLSLIHI